MLDDPDEALRQGYYFSPASAHYQAMFEVADDALQLPAGDVQDWLELAPTERAPWLERGDLRASAALLLLEEAALRREELLARDELKRLLLGRQAKDNAGSAGAPARLDAVLAPQGQLMRPAALLASGSGLPQRAGRRSEEQ